MLLGRISVSLGVQQVERIIQLPSGMSGQNDFIHIASLSRQIRIGKPLPEFVDAPLPLLFQIVGLSQFLPVNDVDSSIGSHYSNLCGRKGEVDVRAYLL